MGIKEVEFICSHKTHPGLSKSGENGRISNHRIHKFYLTEKFLQHRKMRANTKIGGEGGELQQEGAYSPSKKPNTHPKNQAGVKDKRVLYVQ